MPAAVVWVPPTSGRSSSTGSDPAATLGVPVRGIEGGRHIVAEDHPATVAQAIARCWLGGEARRAPRQARARMPSTASCRVAATRSGSGYTLSR